MLILTNKTNTEMTLTKNEIITLKHLADGDQHNDTPLSLTTPQFISALESLKAKDMVRACINYGKVLSSEIDTLGIAALDDLAEEALDNDAPLFNEKEEKVLLYLGDGKSHSTAPTGMTKFIFKQVCRLLERKELVETYEKKNGWEVCITDNGKDAVEYIKKEKSRHLSPLQATLLKLLCNNELISNIQTYSPFNMYSVEELYNEFLPLKEKNMIVFFSDKSGGPRSLTHMKIMDEGRIALRKYKEKHPEANLLQQQPNQNIINDEDKKLIDNLEPYCDTRETAEQLAQTLRRLTSNMQVTNLINNMLASEKIKEGFAKGKLHKILHDAGIYKAKKSNWNTKVKNYKNQL